ncbi:hypothetical protein, partial [Brevibacterium paucivorans]|uniref:hypothetical protein n=1 Tax=Brevibacterium paucivorans TaxID=170994 RepID=UPI0021554C70
RIHRSNLIGMGVLPMQFPAGESADTLGLDGTETFSIAGVEQLNEGVTPKTLKVTATKDNGETVEFDAASYSKVASRRRTRGKMRGPNMAIAVRMMSAGTIMMKQYPAK